MKTFEIVMHEDRNVRLSGLLQEVGGEFAPVEKRPGVIVLPGGGYGICSDREADPVALEFARAGYQAFILRYTVSAVEKEKIWPHPLEDYDEAWEIIESHAEEWHVDMDRIRGLRLLCRRSSDCLRFHDGETSAESGNPRISGDSSKDCGAVRAKYAASLRACGQPYAALFSLRRAG